MGHKINVKCIHCQSEKVVKNGLSSNSTQRWRCKSCKKSFQLHYSYNAHKPGIKKQIIEQTMNNSGVRDISRNLQIAKGTVISTLKKKSLLK